MSRRGQLAGVVALALLWGCSGGSDAVPNATMDADTASAADITEDRSPEDAGATADTIGTADTTTGDTDLTADTENEGPDADLPAEPPSMLYISLWAERVGQLTFPPTSHHYHVLADSTKTHMALAFIAEQGVNELAFYNLGTILADAERTQALGDFIVAARALGVRRAIAIGSSASGFDQIATYQNQRLRDRPDASFDGLLTEFEFWQAGGDLGAYLSLLEHMQALTLVDRNGQPVQIATYQGWLHNNSGAASLCEGAALSDAACIAELVSQRVDRVLLHVYTNTPEQGPGYGAERFDHYRNASTPVEILPIFSYEDPEFAAGTEHFSGEWLCQNKAGGLAGAEAAFNAAASEPAVGFAHYSYFFADMYLNYAACP